MEPQTIKKEELQKLIDDVPDVGDPEQTCISYWQKLPDGRMIYLEGWADACLAGTGFPLIGEGEWDKKITYIQDQTNEILPRQAKERGYKLVEGGFIPKTEDDFTEHLYGVTWGIYEKLPKWVGPQEK